MTFTGTYLSRAEPARLVKMGEMEKVREKRERQKTRLFTSTLFLLNLFVKIDFCIIAGFERISCEIVKSIPTRM